MTTQNGTAAKKPSVITFEATKGGVGKSRYAILISKCLAAAGFKVLDFDFDTSTHSLTNYFLKTDEETLHKARRTHNNAQAIFYPDNNLADFALETEYENIDLIPISASLPQQRTVEYRRLAQIVEHTTGYDFVVIDCSPNYDNFCINAVLASDFIITPCLQDDDSFNSAVSLRGCFESEMENKMGNWFVTINGYNKRWENANSSVQQEYIDRIETNFQNITPRECWFPWTSDIRKINDRKMPLSNKPIKNGVCNEKLYDAVCNLAECFIGEGELKRPEYF